MDLTEFNELSAHTPGPWFPGRALRGGQECIIGDGDSVVCFMPDRTIGCTFVRDDALLIAAAPELLDALRSYIELGHSDTAMREARAAIAKATGAQP